MKSHHSVFHLLLQYNKVNVYPLTSLFSKEGVKRGNYPVYRMFQTSTQNPIDCKVFRLNDGLQKHLSLEGEYVSQ